MRVLLDTNLVLAVLLDRAPFVGASSAVWEACDAGRLTGCLLASALTDIFSIARRAEDVATARIAVGLCLAAFEVLPVDQSTVEAATALPGTDFEDNLPIACAAAAQLNAIVTRNPGDFAAAPLPVFTPAALLARL